MRSPSSRPPLTRALRRLLVPLLGTALAVTAALGVPTGAEAADRNVATPGNFTGYGFDQCLAPSQQAMDTWLVRSPFWAVGIYISGASRACRDQPNLTPEWVSTQLAHGWRLLPITLGPQAACNPRFPRYDNDRTISPKRSDSGAYPTARRQGAREADKAVTAAKALGLVRRSTLWYDIEAFDVSKKNCRESALVFLSAWTSRLHELGWVSGVYSSASSGIKMLDDARVNRPDRFTMPDRVWLARWDGLANTSSSYVRADGWVPGGRVKQYRGPRNETWGGVTINIDRNYLDLGKGSFAPPEVHCVTRRYPDGVSVSRRTYREITPDLQTFDRVQALQCLLREAGLYAGRLNGVYTDGTRAAAQVWQERRGLRVGDRWTLRAWQTLLTRGPGALVKIGSAGADVRRLQRGLNAAGAGLPVTGVFRTATDTALRRYQRAVGIRATGVAAAPVWQALRAGKS
jgi:hypothetical protein